MAIERCRKRSLNGTRIATLASQLQTSSLGETPLAHFQVFGIPELLERTLLFLPARSLWHLRRVCTKWNDLIHRTAQLKLHLFASGLWNLPSRELRLLDYAVPGLSITSDLSDQRVPKVVVEMTALTSVLLLAPEARNRVQRRTHTFHSCAPHESEKVPRMDPNDFVAKQEDLKLHFFSDKTPRFAAQDQLLICQPPITRIRGRVIPIIPYIPPGHNPNAFPIQASIHADDGITLGTLAVAAQRMLAEVVWHLTPEGEMPDAQTFERLRVRFEGLIALKSVDDAHRARLKTAEVELIRG